MRDPLPQAGGRPGLIAVVGVGNEWRRDDGAGLEVARRLRAPGLPAFVRVLESPGEPVRLLDSWAGAYAAIIVDASHSGAPPGTVHRHDPLAEPVPAEAFRASSHSYGVAEAVELARVLDRLPARLELIGIEGADFGDGPGLSAPVEDAAQRVAAELGERLERLESSEDFRTSAAE